MTARDEVQALALFQERYRNTPSALAGQIERRVIVTGADKRKVFAAEPGRCGRRWTAEAEGAWPWSPQ